VIVPQLAMFRSNQKKLVAEALKRRMPLVSPILELADHGGLLSYGTPREENYRRAAVLVNKILRGAKPEDLPVEQPDRFYLVINRHTAERIGAEITPALRTRADRIVD
jgi:putative ABC transport system substrate-binding protein